MGQRIVLLFSWIFRVLADHSGKRCVSQCVTRGTRSDIWMVRNAMFNVIWEVIWWDRKWQTCANHNVRKLRRLPRGRQAHQGCQRWSVSSWSKLYCKHQTPSLNMNKVWWIFFLELYSFRVLSDNEIGHWPTPLSHNFWGPKSCSGVMKGYSK